MRYVPALDGLRGVAVLGVLCFHAGLSGFPGGFLGVSTFFTLSGFLITALLLHDYESAGRLHLRRFWGRRIRRLMPAAILALVGIAIYASLAVPPDQLGDVRGDLLAALLDVANWHFLLSGQTYGDLSAGPGLVQHFWSLSIEEQFYFVFPLVVLLALRYGGRRLLAGTIVVLAVLSVASSALFTHVSVSAESAGADAAYYATNVRAVELLLGALLAVWVTRLSPHDDHRPSTARSWRIGTNWSLVGLFALVLTMTAWAFVELDNPWLVRGGLALHAVGVVLILLAIVRETETGGPVSHLLGWEPLRQLGLVSYGVYLYHWPLFLFLDEQRTGLSGVPLFLLRFTVTLGVAVLSYALVEQPIRRGAGLSRRRPALLALPAGAIALVGAIAVVSIPSVPVDHADTRLEDFAPQVVSGPAPVADKGPSAAPATAGAGRGPTARTMLVIGDSALYDVAPALTAAATASGMQTVVDSTWPGVGLTNTFDWRTTWGQLIDRYDPEVVVVMIGRWDRNFVHRNGEAAYQPLVDEAANLLSGDGAKLLWLDPISYPTETGEEKWPFFDNLQTLLPGRVDRTNVNPVLKGPDGAWLETEEDRSGAVVPVRKPDHYHLCQAGALRVTDAIMARLMSLGLAKQPGDGWQAGGWRQHQRYNSPPEECQPISAGRTVPS